MALLIIPASEIAQADTYPSRPITILVPFPPGGSSDVVMRLLADEVAARIGQLIIIDNRSGGGGTVAAIATKNSAPDGYTLMLGNIATHVINPALFPNTKSDPIKDFTPITTLVTLNNVLLVPEKNGAKSVADIISTGKVKPARLTYGSQGVGSGGHLLGLLFAKSANVDFIHVPYRGATPAITDLLAGRIDLLFSSYLSAASYVEAGQLRILAIAGPKRHPIIPDVPTMAEAGYPEVDLEQWLGLFGPAELPAEIVHRLNVEFTNALRSERVMNKVMSQVAFVSPSEPGELGEIVKRDLFRVRHLLRAAGLDSTE